MRDCIVFIYYLPRREALENVSEIAGTFANGFLVIYITGVRNIIYVTAP